MLYIILKHNWPESTSSTDFIVDSAIQINLDDFHSEESESFSALKDEDDDPEILGGRYSTHLLLRSEKLIFYRHPNISVNQQESRSLAIRE